MFAKIYASLLISSRALTESIFGIYIWKPIPAANASIVSPLEKCAQHWYLPIFDHSSSDPLLDM
jgi:hypothetical protein